MPLTDGQCDYCLNHRKTEEPLRIDSEFIQEVIDRNYAVLLAFDLAEGNLTLKEYLDNLKEYNKSTKGNDGK